MWRRVRRIPNKNNLTYMSPKLVNFESNPWTYEEVIHSIYVNRHNVMNVETETVYDEDTDEYIQKVILGDYEKVMAYNKLRRQNCSAKLIFSYFRNFSM